MIRIFRFDRATRTLWIASIALGFLVLAVSARADWAEDFDAGFAQTWTFVALDDAGNFASAGTESFVIVEAGVNDYLSISDSTVAERGGGGGAADGFGFVSEIFGDTGISAEINAEPLDGQQNLLGVIARVNSQTAAGYVAVIDFANSRFAIAKTDGSTGLQPLAVDTSVLIDRDEIYRVEFVLFGSDLSAQLTVNSTGEVLSTITVADFEYASGVAGILVETEFDIDDFPVAPIIGTFDDVWAVPEPSMGSLIAWGVGALVMFQRRRLA